MTEVLEQKENGVQTKEKIVLDLGCGQNKVSLEYIKTQMNLPFAEKIIGIDLFKTDAVDVQHDLFEFPYPFEDESVHAVFASHFFEHVPAFDRPKFMDELYRILEPNGRVRFIHPYWTSQRAIQDFTHQWPPICEDSYLYFRKEWREANKLTHGYYNMKCNFEGIHTHYTMHDQSWLNKAEETRNFAFKHYHRVIDDMCVDLIKR